MRHKRFNNQLFTSSTPHHGGGGGGGARRRGRDIYTQNAYAAMPKRALDDTATNPRVSATRETLNLKRALESWGLHDVARNVPVNVRCRLAPMCATVEAEREAILRAEPTLCASSASYAEDVFAETSGRDALAWACESSWSRFPTPKVAMVSGWGAPGSLLHSNKRMTLVHGFDEVLHGKEALNLQMFHRADGDEVPVLPRKLKWPAEEYFATEPIAGSRVNDVRSVVLDDATRVSAKGALTWWHLDDCGEFVFQVGLPEAREVEPTCLLGQSGKPVVKLFIFAEKRDYAWIAQDAEMNKSMRNSALDIFDTPAHFFPTAAEMRAPSSTSLDASNPSCFDGEPRVDTTVCDPSPIFWIAPLEAGGPPLLSPPNLIHCVLTVRDCVMVEERRLSLAFMDEVLYFQRRASRWIEPPIFYSFVRDDLSDPVKARRNAVEPLVRLLDNDIREAFDVDAKGEREMERARHFARCFMSLRTLAEHAPEFYALDADGIAFAKSELARFKTWCDGASTFATSCRRALDEDVRVAEHDSLVEQMLNETLGTHVISDNRMCAAIHEKGRPRWGPVRESSTAVEEDRREMKKAIRAGTLDNLLKTYRQHILATNESV
jgi:hypothetical protein